MRRASSILQESVQIGTVKDLTSVFESLASTQVAKVKGRVELSRQFFQLLWSRYTAIRIDPKTRITNRELGDGSGKTVFIIISAETGLSGNIDQRLVDTMQQAYDPKTTDIIVLGSHGAAQLQQRNIPYVRFFKVPESDKYIDVSPVIDAVLNYARVVVYYEKYESLGDQEIETIDLVDSMREMSHDVADEEVIDVAQTIFEPSLDDIADQMEISMMILTLSQSILESGLAQSASRFNAMAVAKKHANELLGEYAMEFHRAKRSESDRRLREVMTTLKKKKQHMRASQ
ncbi:MAG: F0F1 ATP synthase subunit gamma [Candidatus Saccharimonadota bacterium]